ncbi:sigma-70 family RNA polymerase sigma factor [Amycolatopsis acidiphila]|uniref:RNA polymerase sigma factor n=1 Tax=Amycolatopsis acidiphila TaxID=715473 RepID=A0A558A480_9PSEU|nr:sigma-70 family RNA polymerase sigma factor [Amycolatopsis acidiphila]TVT19071.1 sigma-70 family RNA polymerase sigma factor [Amycolatopsis acidiphila]UIJ63686.1 sigma-70 family RNA polymerase sigma factor [Amycolatopsis acidiphila]GHG67460.1 RNA polymerase sigma factor [Amycolatopsis acidiphila]
MTRTTTEELDDAEFTRRTEPYRRELLAHCYRMLGSVHDAEDLVQETYLRAWRSYARFEGRSSLRTWLYQIATNACLSALGHRARRVLPSGLGGPADDPGAPVEPGGPGVAWLEPMPDALVSPESADPAAIVAAREGLRLALIACLQHLPARQRAVLILRDVLAWPAAEVAAALGLSTAAVKSLLQRARGRLAELEPAGARIAEPSEPAARAVLEKYVAAFENSDPHALERLLREDATLEMTPARTWFAGRATCLPFIAAQAIGSPGDWRMVAVRANGQQAAAAYLRDARGVYRAFGVAVLTTTASQIARITLFGDPGLVELFGLPPVAA